MRSEDKIEVSTMRMGDKDWVKVTFQKRTDWVPSFEDLHWIIQDICTCEDDKYPGGEGRGMVRRFLNDCCEKRKGSREEHYEKLRQRYKLPYKE